MSKTKDKSRSSGEESDCEHNNCEAKIWGVMSDANLGDIPTDNKPEERSGEENHLKNIGDPLPFKQE
ncbi:MAG: hypothetical protein Kow0090_04440 [Myxococcota bacterium]